MDPAQFWLIGGGAAWVAVAVAIAARVLPPTARHAVTRRGGARCLVGAALGVGMLMLLLWATAGLDPLPKAVIALALHFALAGFLLAYAMQVQPGVEILGLARPMHQDVLRGVGTYLAFMPVVMAAHVLNLVLVGQEVETVQRSVHDVLAHDGPDRFALILNVTIAVPLFEEFLFRGLLQQGIRSQLLTMMPPRRAGTLSVVVASVAFTGLHETAAYIPVFVLSLILGFAYERSGRIFVSVALHGSHNLAVVLFQTFLRSIGGGT